MEPIMLVTDGEKEAFSSMIRDYGSITGRDITPSVSIEKILQPWNQNKSQYLFKLLGNKLILSRDITYERSEQEVREELSLKLLAYNNEFQKNFYEETVTKRGLWELQYLMDSKLLYSTINTSRSVSFKDDSGKVIKIPKGCKIMKGLRKVANAFNIDGFEDFRLEHSRILNRKYLEGNLRLSIHPLDYATMSFNECRWSSCMTWDGGEYRQGTVEMMNSPCVVMAYLTANKDMIVGPIHWSNKKWRELFIVDEDIICNIKGYPYAHDGLEKIVIDWLKELSKVNLNWNSWTEESYKIYNNTPVTIGPLSRAVTFDFSTGYMYNDIYANSSTPVLGYISLDAGEYRVIHYSGPSECMSCGETEIEIDNEQFLLCQDCEPVPCCSCCGEYYSENDLIYYNGDKYCEDCFNEHFFCCEICEDYASVEDCKELYLAEDRDVFFSNPCYICSDCATDDRFDKIYIYGNSAVSLQISKCSPQMMRRFGFKDINDWIHTRMSSANEFETIDN